VVRLRSGRIDRQVRNAKPLHELASNRFPEAARHRFRCATRCVNCAGGLPRLLRFHRLHRARVMAIAGVGFVDGEPSEGLRARAALARGDRRTFDVLREGQTG